MMGCIANLDNCQWLGEPISDFVIKLIFKNLRLDWLNGKIAGMAEIERRLTDREIYGLHDSVQHNILMASRTLREITGHDDNSARRLLEDVRDPLALNSAPFIQTLVRSNMGASEFEASVIGLAAGKRIYTNFIISHLEARAKTLPAGARTAAYDMITEQRLDEERDIDNASNGAREGYKGLFTDEKWNTSWNTMGNSGLALGDLFFSSRLQLIEVKTVLAQGAERLADTRILGDYRQGLPEIGHEIPEDGRLVWPAGLSKDRFIALLGEEFIDDIWEIICNFKRGVEEYGYIPTLTVEPGVAALFGSHFYQLSPEEQATKIKEAKERLRGFNRQEPHS